jgi:hypothetical protein
MSAAADRGRRDKPRPQSFDPAAEFASPDRGYVKARGFAADNETAMTWLYVGLVLAAVVFVLVLILGEADKMRSSRR